MNQSIFKVSDTTGATALQNWQYKGLPVPSNQQLSVQELFAIGNKYHASGQLEKAELIFQAILKQFPRHPGALHFLGVINHQCGNLTDAIKLIRKAIKVEPKYHTAYNNLGNVYRSANDIRKAKHVYKRAVELKPSYAEAHFNLGVIARFEEDFAMALDHFKSCVDSNPRHIESHLEIGKISLAQGEKFNAQIAFKTVLHLDETHQEARCKLAFTLEALKQFDAGLKEYQIALKFAPESIPVLNGIARLSNKTGQFKEAMKYLQQALAEDKDNLETLTNLGITYQNIGDLIKAKGYFERVLKLNPDAVYAEKCLLFLCLNDANYSHSDLFDYHLKLRSRHDKPEFTGRGFEDRSTELNRKLKIGYLSSDFKTHVVALNVLPLIMGHNREEFEIFLYYHSDNSDQITKAFIDNSDHMQFVETMNDQEISHMIMKDKIDILVILAGRFNENRPLVATYRPAPIQVSFHDCATSGLDAMDYFFTDSVIHPQSTEEKFTEKLYRLPTYYQYPVQVGVKEVTCTPALDNDFITFCSFNKPEKITDAVVELWSRVLHAVPNSKLLLKYFNFYSEDLIEERTLNRFANCGIDKERLILNSSSDSRVDHLFLYHQADIALDPFPFNGATTTFEALSMGVPVITLQGDHFVSRVAASMVTHIGHPEFAPITYEEYVDIAKFLCEDVEKLNKIRLGLRSDLENSSLCNSAEYAKNVETAFRNMWHTWCKTGGYNEN